MHALQHSGNGIFVSFGDHGVAVLDLKVHGFPMGAGNQHNAVAFLKSHSEFIRFGGGCVGYGNGFAVHVNSHKQRLSQALVIDLPFAVHT
jgi:hypothetical protein